MTSDELLRIMPNGRMNSMKKIGEHNGIPVYEEESVPDGLLIIIDENKLEYEPQINNAELEDM